PVPVVTKETNAPVRAEETVAPVPVPQGAGVRLVVSESIASKASQARDESSDSTPTPPPPGLLTVPELGATTERRTRSGIWPLALALGGGVALGFAGGFGVGSRDRGTVPAAALPHVGNVATPTSDQPLPSPAVQLPAQPSVLREEPIV